MPAVLRDQPACDRDLCASTPRGSVAIGYDPAHPLDAEGREPGHDDASECDGAAAGVHAHNVLKKRRPAYPYSALRQTIMEKWMLKPAGGAFLPLGRRKLLLANHRLKAEAQV